MVRACCVFFPQDVISEGTVPDVRLFNTMLAAHVNARNTAKMCVTCRSLCSFACKMGHSASLLGGGGFRRVTHAVCFVTFVCARAVIVDQMERFGVEPNMDTYVQLFMGYCWTFSFDKACVWAFRVFFVFSLFLSMFDMCVCPSYVQVRHSQFTSCRCSAVACGTVPTVLWAAQPQAEHPRHRASCTLCNNVHALLQLLCVLLCPCCDCMCRLIMGDGMWRGYPCLVTHHSTFSNICAL